MRMATLSLVLVLVSAIGATVNGQDDGADLFAPPTDPVPAATTVTHTGIPDTVSTTHTGVPSTVVVTHQLSEQDRARADALIASNAPPAVAIPSVPAIKGGYPASGAATLYGNCDKKEFGEGIGDIDWMDPEKRSGRGSTSDGLLIVWRLYFCSQEEGGVPDVSVQMGNNHEQKLEEEVDGVYWVAFVVNGENVSCQVRLEEGDDPPRLLAHAKLVQNGRRKLSVRTISVSGKGGEFELDSLNYCLERIYRYAMITSDAQDIGFSLVYEPGTGYRRVANTTSFDEQEFVDMMLDQNWWTVLGLTKPARKTYCCDCNGKKVPTPAAASVSATSTVIVRTRTSSGSVQK